MNENEFILAMYDIRGKQSYIYKSTKMKEIVGASLIIRDCFTDYLFTAAKEYAKDAGYANGIFTYRDSHEESESAFTKDNLIKHFESGYLGEVVYDGGGNFLVIYRNVEVYREINKIFSVNVLKETYSLRILTSYITDLDFSNYKADRDRLYEVHRQRERKECSIHPVNSLPIVQVDYQSSLPLNKTIPILGEYCGEEKANADKAKDDKEILKKVSKESDAKYKKYWSVFKQSKEDRDIQGAKILDDMITGKGEDSHLAVIYIDGNNMGAQVQSCIVEKVENSEETKNYSYEDAIFKLRKFSDNIQEYYINETRKNIEDKLKEKEDLKQAKRFVVYAGDEMTFVCNAKYAYEVVHAYFSSLDESYKEDQKKPANERAFKERPTSCAGIAIFKSHAPFADAYRIAEECCESGKQFMKKEGLKTACFMDFHYCQGAVGTSLDDIREHEETTDMSRPWCISCDDDIKRENYFTTEDVDRLCVELSKAEHSNSKNLGQAAKKGKVAFKLEKDRIIAHKKDKDIDFSLDGKLDDEKLQKYIYDIMQVYDLWFKEEKSEAKEKEEGEKHE